MMKKSCLFIIGLKITTEMFQWIAQRSGFLSLMHLLGSQPILE